METSFDEFGIDLEYQTFKENLTTSEMSAALLLEELAGNLSYAESFILTNQHTESTLHAISLENTVTDTVNQTIAKSDSTIDLN